MSQLPTQWSPNRALIHPGGAACHSRVREYTVAAVALVLSLLSLAVAPVCVVADGGDDTDRQAAFVGEPYWDSDMGSLVLTMEIADLDGDGQSEILVGTERGELRALRADGTQRLLAYTGESVRSIHVADLDGQPEILVLSTLGTLWVRQGESLSQPKGRLLWSYPSAEGEEVQPAEVVDAVDLTGDGQPEILVGTQTGQLHVLEGETSLSWSETAPRWGEDREPGSHQAEAGVDRALVELAVEDLTGDGQPEVLVRSAAGRLHLLRGEMSLPPGEARELWSYPTGGTAEGVVVADVAVADLTGEGQPEILVGTEAGALHVLQAADGVLLGEHTVDHNIQFLDTDDLNGDSRPEVVAGSSRGISVLDLKVAAGLSQGDSMPELEVQVLWQHAIQGDLVQANIVGVEFASPAILIQDSEGAAVVRKRQSGAASVIEGVRLRGGGSGVPAVFGDVNGDGFGEVAVATGRSVRLFGYSARALGSGSRWAFSTGGPVTAAAFGDVDVDEDPEIVVGSRDRKIYILSEGQAADVALTAGGPINAVRLDDVDADGLDEIFAISTDGRVYAHSWADGLLWLRNIGSNLTSLEVVDLHGNGLRQVVLGSSLGRVYALRPNDGEEIWSFLTGDAVSALAVGDVSGDDGRLEVLVGSANSLVYALSSAGEFTWLSVLSKTATAVSVADLEGDARPEVLAASLDGQLHALSGEDGRKLWQRPVGGAKSLATADLDNDGRLEVLVGSANSWVYALSSAGEVIWDSELSDAVTMVSATDLEGDGRLEVLAGTEDGKVCVLHADSGEQQREYTSIGSKVTYVGAVDMDGDNLSEIVAAADDGKVHLYGYTLNQVPLLVNPTFVRAGDGWIYSVEVNDPEGDEVYLWLEVSDPAHPPGSWPWQRYEQRAESERGGFWQLPLYKEPYSFWDGGHETRFRFGFTDGDDTEAPLPEVEGPRVPGWPWELMLGLLLAVLLVLAVGGYAVVRRQRRLWSNSPEGQAKQLYDRIAQEPTEFLGEIRRFLAESDNAARVAQILTELYILYTRHIDSPAEEEVVEGYALMLSGPDLLVGGLRTLLSGLGELEEVEGQEEALAVYELFHAGLEADSVPGITALRPQMEAVPRLAEHSILRLPGLVGLLALMYPVLDDLERYEQTLAAEDKIRHLGHAIHSLSGEWDREIQGSFTEPERSLLITIGEGWRTVANGALSRREKEWAESPAGRAKQIYDHVDRNPRELLVEIRCVVDEWADAPTVLAEMERLFPPGEDQSAQAEVTGGYGLMLRGPELQEGGLRTLVSGLGELEEVEGQQEARAVYELLLAGLDANSVSRIAALRSQTEAVHPLAEKTVLGPPGLGQVLSLWAEIIDSLQKCERVQAPDDKKRYLGRAGEGLTRLERETRQTLAEPERSLVGEIGGRWLAVVNNAQVEIRGRAELKFVLKTHKVLAVGDISLVLGLENEGNAPAEHVTVELLPSPQYEILEGSRSIPSLPVGRSDSAELRLCPQAEERFRAEFRVTYDDEQRKGKVRFPDHVVSLIEVAQEFQPIENPYTAGPSLDAGSPLFFGREDVFAFIRKNISSRHQDHVLVLIGQRRSGKTSLLKQLPERLPEQYVPVFIDGQGLGVDPGMANLFYRLSDDITRGLREQGVEVTPPSRPDYETAPAQTFERRFLAEVQGVLGDRRLVLTIDEFEELEARVHDGSLDRTIFPFLRHLMQHSERLAFIFVGTHRLEQLRRDYWFIFFNIALNREIRFLDDEAARRLITVPVEGVVSYDDSAVERILEITAGHPYFLQLTCQALVNFLDASQRNYVTTQDVRDVVADILELGEGHFGWIWANASREEQLVLAALAHPLTEETLVPSSDVANKLAEYGQRMDSSAVKAILQGLAAQDIVEVIQDHSPLFRFRLDLIRLWIARSRHLSAVVEEVT